MSGFASRWVVLRHEPVAPGDVEDDGTVREIALRRWVDAACDDYLARCHRFGALAADARHAAHRELQLPGSLRSDAASVVVSARATEVWPAACKLSVRVRASSDEVVDAACIVSLRDDTGAAVELGNDVRDELIALEHVAEHFN